MKNGIILLLLICALSVSAKNYNQSIDTFLAEFKSGKVDEAIDKLYTSNPYVSAMTDQIKNLKVQLKSLKGLAGDMQYYKKLDEFIVKDSLVQVTYLVVYERMPVKFEFQYFKANSGWRIYSFSFDDKVFDLVEPKAQDRAFSG